MQKIKLFSLLIALVMPISSVASSIEAVDLLNKMNDAQRQLEYSGRLVFIKNGEPSVLSIEQTIENGVRKETIVPLDEKASNTMRETSSLSLGSFATPITKEMQNIYSFDLGELDQVAGRPCQIVIARPKDRKRYLQKYCVDLQKNILLEYSLTNLERKSVERFMFTDFKVNARQTNHTVTSMPVSLTDNHSLGFVPAVHVQKVQGHGQGQVKRKTDTSKWFFASLPIGFRRMSGAEGASQNNEEEHIIITDGLSSASVFIAKDGGKQVDPNNTMVKSGALNILTKVQGDYTVTLVGEVPSGTLQDIYSGLRSSH